MECSPDCIEGGDNAGIFYGTTGVCVQIANRILAAVQASIPLSSQHVRKAIFLYTTFGRNFNWVPMNRRWPERIKSCYAGTKLSSSGQSTASSDIMAWSDRTEPNSRAELSSLVEAGLGHRVDDGLLDALEESSFNCNDSRKSSHSF